MLRRSRLHRLCSGLTGAWFVVFGALAPLTVSCPMHAAATAHATAHAPATRGAVGATHGGHAEGLAHHALASSSVPDRPTDAPSPAHSCDCATSCCSAPTTSIPVPPAAVAIATISPTTPALIAASSPRLASRPRLLPFAQGPPA